MAREQPGHVRLWSLGSHLLRRVAITATDAVDEVFASFNPSMIVWQVRRRLSGRFAALAGADTDRGQSDGEESGNVSHLHLHGRASCPDEANVELRARCLLPPDGPIFRV